MNGSEDEDHGNQAASSPVEEPETQDNNEYTPYRPYVTELEHEDGSRPAYQPFALPQSGRFGPSYMLPEGLEATPAALSQLFLPDDLIDTIVLKTRAHAHARLPPGQLKNIERKDILRFLAIYFYMGLVKLPSKKDYWRAGESAVWPVHPIFAHMPRVLFEYIWRNVHLTDVEPEEAAVEEAVQDRADDEEEFDQDDDNNNPNQEADMRWYVKAAPIVDHMNAVSKKVCRHPSFACSVDEMMKLFKGRSKQTHRMKNKPIKEGYKFYAMCDTKNGFIWHCNPDGRGERDGNLSDLV